VKRRANLFIILATLFSYLFVGLAPAGRFVICVEPGGKIAIETSGIETGSESKNCTQSCDGAGADGAGSIVINKSAGDCPCVDVPLGEPIDSQKLDNQRIVFSNVRIEFVSILEPQIVYFTNASSRQLCTPAIANDRTRSNIRSVVFIV